MAPQRILEMRLHAAHAPDKALVHNMEHVLLYKLVANAAQAKFATASG